MPVYKATIEVTVFLEAKSVKDAARIISDTTLSDLEHEIDAGDWIGRKKTAATKRVFKKDAAKELGAIGGEPSFFEEFA